ncbi:MAG: hypothetical protein L6Q71_04465 [Planctomycetes bacterium]|nr:hypothetical protein [Planctomycetota bacterium]NUQ35912.1 hypothetical protein [Planctomycetaceae bacterium]
MATVSTEDAFYEQLSARVLEIAREHSQQLIASRTATPKQTVSRYVAGGRPSPWFLHSLVRGFAINPSWLLTGEGTKLLTDVTADTSRMAGNLLDLVKAMGAVTERKLGSLVGKQHLMVLRELNDALISLESIQERVSQESEETFRKIIGDLAQALNEGQLDRMESLIRTGSQISRLSFNRELQREFKALVASATSILRDFETSIPLFREALFEHIATGKLVDAVVIERVNRFALTLRVMLRLREARNVCDAFLALLRDKAEHIPTYHHLVSLAAYLHVECGDLPEALPKLTQSRSLANEKNRAFSSGFNLAHALFYTGSMRFHELGSLELREDMAVQIPNAFALWTANKEHLESVLKRNERSPNLAHPLLHAYARVTFDAISGKGAKALTDADALTAEKIEKDPSHTLRMFSVHIIKAQAARLAGNAKVAKEETKLAEDVLRSGEPDVMPVLLFRAMHWRNVLLLFEQPTGAKEKRMAECARSAVKIHLERGYGMLRELADKIGE